MLSNMDTKEINHNGMSLTCYADGRIWRESYKCGCATRNGNWAKQFLSKRGYMVSNIGSKVTYVHKLIAKAFLDDYSENLQVDHIDGNKINNHVSNIRMVTRQENARAFIKKSRNTYSKYRGVTYSPKRKKWVAQLGRPPQKFIGHFTCEHEAAQAVNQQMMQYGYFPEALNKIETQ